MNSRRAKEILALHRPGGGDDADPELAQALEQLRADAELARWFEQHQAFQRSLRATLQGLPVPEGLKERILAGQRTKIIALRWRRSAFLAAAAAVLVLIALSRFWLTPPEDDSFVAYRDRMVGNALRNYRMDLLTNDLNAIRSFLSKTNVHGDYTLTQGLAKLPGLGCAALRWHNHPVAMICFDRGNQEVLYLFVIDRSKVSEPPGTAAPVLLQVNKLMTASWSVGAKAYLLAGRGDRQALRAFF